MTSVKACVVAAVLVLLAGCGGAPTEPRDFEFGRVDVYVRDEAGQPIDRIPVRLERLNGQVEDAGGLTGTAGPAGYYLFLQTGGDYRVVITVEPGFTLAPGQSSAVPVTFRRNQTQTVNFVLRRG